LIQTPMHPKTHVLAAFLVYLYIYLMTVTAMPVMGASTRIFTTASTNLYPV
jgi:hypothetical protein